jgi:biotin-(acetyl-CoA carboxylase) ligase
VLDNFDKNLIQYKTLGFEPIRKNVLSQLYKLNESVELDYLGKRLKGVISDISSTGDLVLNTENGTEIYKTGEIFA